MPSQAAINELNRIDDAPETPAQTIARLRYQNARLESQLKQTRRTIRQIADLKIAAYGLDCTVDEYIARSQGASK